MSYHGETERMGLPSSPLRTKGNRSVHSKVSANGVTDAGDVFGDGSLVRRASDRLSRCPRFVRGTCVGRMPEAYQWGSNSDRLCDLCRTAFGSVCIDQTTAPRRAC